MHLSYELTVLRVRLLTSCLYRVVQKNAQILMHCHFATVCSRITQFSPKCSEINR